MISRLQNINLKERISFPVFFRDFISAPVKIGAITQSSNVLAKAMIDNLALNPRATVIELGPGTGVLTEQIYEKTNNYLGIEQSPRFTQFLNRRFPELDFVNGLAEDGVYHYKNNGMSPPDVIICSLPLAGWSTETQDLILNTLDSLMQPGGIFRMFQYAHSYFFPGAIQFRRNMSALFGPHRRSSVVLWNLPPAFVLTWQRDQLYRE